MKLDCCAPAPRLCALVDAQRPLIDPRAARDQAIGKAARARRTWPNPIAARAPDHGKLAPWRFVVIADDQRDALERVLREALAEEDPDASPAKHEKEGEFAHYAGQLVVLVSAPVADHKIPLWEQELSCGAAAMSLLVAAHALGYVAGWVTGWRAYSPTVSQAFCEPGERIAGFVFIGHPGRELEERQRPPLSQVLRKWQPPRS